MVKADRKAKGNEFRPPKNVVRDPKHKFKSVVLRLCDPKLMVNFIMVYYKLIITSFYLQT